MTGELVSPAMSRSKQTVPAGIKPARQPDSPRKVLVSEQTNQGPSSSPVLAAADSSPGRLVYQQPARLLTE